MTDTITTAEELDALPVGSVWLDLGVGYSEADAPVIGCKAADGDWWIAGTPNDRRWRSFEVMRDSDGHVLVCAYRPDQPTESTRVLPSREEIAEALHADTCAEDPDEGEACGCDAHYVYRQADIIQALYASQRTEAEVKAEAWEEAATWFDADLCGVSLIIRDRANRLSAAQPTPVFEAMGLPTPEVPSVGGEQHD